MSEYPRPPEAAPTKPYLPDRIFALLYAAFLIGHKVVLLADMTRPYGFIRAFGAWWAYLLPDLAYLVFELWVLLVLTRNRLWAFVATLVFTILSLISCVWLKNLQLAVVVFPFFVYTVARLCRMIGPRPLRRYETR